MNDSTNRLDSLIPILYRETGDPNTGLRRGEGHHVHNVLAPPQGKPNPKRNNRAEEV